MALHPWLLLLSLSFGAVPGLSDERVDRHFGADSGYIIRTPREGEESSSQGGVCAGCGEGSLLKSSLDLNKNPACVSVGWGVGVLAGPRCAENRTVTWSDGPGLFRHSEKKKKKDSLVGGVKYDPFAHALLMKGAVGFRKLFNQEFLSSVNCKDRDTCGAGQGGGKGEGRTHLCVPVHDARSGKAIGERI